MRRQAARYRRSHAGFNISRERVRQILQRDGMVSLSVHGQI